jgi:26S proteasome regulatory subunit N3
MVQQGLALADHTVTRIQSLNRRTLDQLAGRVFFYYARFHELAGGNEFAAIRPTLLSAQRTAALRNDNESQATLLNLLMRNYFHSNLYDQADKLVAKTTFPDTAGNPQLARWSYYLGARSVIAV